MKSEVLFKIVLMMHRADAFDRILSTHLQKGSIS